MSASPCGLLLAAGAGRRFRAAAGEAQADKLMQRLPDGRFVAVAAAQNLRAALPRVVAVVRPRAPALVDALVREGIEVVINPLGDAAGLGDSLALGVRHTPDARGWVVALADMPWIEPAVFTQVIDALGDDPMALAAPVHAGQRGHPVAFGAGHREALAALQGDEGARAVLQRHAATLRSVAVDCVGVLADVDTPKDLSGADAIR